MRHADGRALLELTAGDIERWLDATPRAPRTRYTLISCVATFFEWAITRELVESNPTRNIIRPKLHRNLPRPIRHDDLTVAVHMATPMLRVWLLLAALGGLRCQEISGLCREHVWDHERPGVILVVEAKGGGERAVPLHPDVLSALHAHGMPRSGPLFRNQFGTPYSPARVSQLGNAYLRDLGIEARMHQLRHRFGTDVYATSKDLRATQELLGHASPSTTAVYTKVSPTTTAAIVLQLSIRPLVETVA